MAGTVPSRSLDRESEEEKKDSVLKLPTNRLKKGAQDKKKFSSLPHGMAQETVQVALNILKK